MNLYQEIILLQYFHRKNSKYVIENVKPYYKPLIEPTAKLHRHLFWSNFKIGLYETNNERKHTEIKATSTVYDFNVSDTNLKDKAKCLKNMVDPTVSNYILNCARNIITKSNINQLDIFENEKILNKT